MKAPEVEALGRRCIHASVTRVAVVVYCLSFIKARMCFPLTVEYDWRDVRAPGNKTESRENVVH